MRKPYIPKNARADNNLSVYDGDPDQGGGVMKYEKGASELKGKELENFRTTESVKKYKKVKGLK
jgi:hypothetical protein